MNTATATDNPLAPVAALTLPDSVALTASAQRALAFMRSFEITSPDDYQNAADELQAIKSRQKHLEAGRTSITGPLNTALKAVNALFQGPAALLDQAESIVKSKMLTYVNEQRRIEAEARAAAEAQAAAERKHLDDKAAAAQAASRAAAEAAQAAKATGDEQAAALADAEARRTQAEAATLATTSQMIVAPVAAVAAAPAAKGISTSVTIEFEVTDLLQLVQHVAQHPELINLLAADTVKLRAYTKAVGVSCTLPGVRVFPKQTMSARSR